LHIAGGANSVDECTKIDQDGAFQAFATAYRQDGGFFFAWQNDYDYGQYNLTNPCPSGESVV